MGKEARWREKIKIAATATDGSPRRDAIAQGFRA